MTYVQRINAMSDEALVKALLDGDESIGMRPFVDPFAMQEIMRNRRSAYCQYLQLHAARGGYIGKTSREMYSQEER